MLAGDEAAKRAVHANRARSKSEVGRETTRRRSERVERSSAHVLERRGMRRAWLRGRENVHKRYLIHVAGFDLRVPMRVLYLQGTPKEAAEANQAFVFTIRTGAFLIFGLVALLGDEITALVLVVPGPALE